MSIYLFLHGEIVVIVFVVVVNMDLFISFAGTFSRLFLGRMTHASRGEQDALVHVKVLKESTQLESNKEAFEEEAIELTAFDHPNVQSLVGVCVTGRPLCLVFECSDRGDLNQFLRDTGCSHYIIRERPNSSLDPDTKLSKLDQLCIAKQIAAGMQYLSDKGYDHRQLCTKNCIINKSMIVKIANIGLRVARPSTSYAVLGPIEKSKYPVRWLPFESVTSGTFTDSTDVWSFGIVLWEIYSHGMTPYYGMNNDEVITLIREGDILPRPKECPREMYDLMQDCWSLVPHERPTFRFLYEKISALVTGVAV